MKGTKSDVCKGICKSGIFGRKCWRIGGFGFDGFGVGGFVKSGNLLKEIIKKVIKESNKEKISK